MTPENAIKTYMKRNKQTGKTIQRLISWDETKTLHWNAKLFNGDAGNASCFATRYGLNYAGKYNISKDYRLDKSKPALV